MKLGFEETQVPYTSGSQSARVWTERWIKDWVFCPNCGTTWSKGVAPNTSFFGHPKPPNTLPISRVGSVSNAKPGQGLAQRRWQPRRLFWV